MPSTDGAFTFGSLFAGIGGMDLGLERSGMQCRWQVEIDPFTRRVLAKHWPDVRRHDDVKTFPPTNPEDWSVDLICGGFPCQDISYAGLGAGLAGARSGLWYEYARIVREVRPRYVLVENVAALLVRGLSEVLGTLASLGYDSEWLCLPAAAVGAPHIRERVFILAHPEGRDAGGEGDGRDQRSWQSGPGFGPGLRDQPGRCRETLADTSGVDGLKFCSRPRGASLPGMGGSTPEPGHPDFTHTDGQGLAVGTCFGGHALAELQATQRGHCEGSGVWATEPDVGRVAHGVPDRVHRLRGLGNAVVPQVAQWLGERILEHAGRADANP